MNTDYRDKHLLDVTDPQEPVYDQPKRVEDYESWIDELQPGNEQLDGSGERHE
jgi:hypothetical protein